MRNAAIAFTVLVISLLAGGLYLISTSGDDEESPAVTTSPSGTATRAPTASSAPSSTADPLEGVCADNPDPASDDTNQVDSPLAGDSITSPLNVEGRIAAFEATFKITIFDASGDEIADITGMSEEGQTLSPFSEDIGFAIDEDTPACIWVYENSARDGSAVNVIQIPVVLLATDSVCLPNPDPATDDVNRVDTPFIGEAVRSPVPVTGEIAAFEATFKITIFDADGAIIADEVTMSAEGQVLAPFSKDVAFSVSEDTPACLWVYENSARDGEPIHVVQVPITLAP